ncbi:hypothetical protein SACS_1088 [Parasaccharibacter apium]|uniref:Uncharacterized protein n=1 Tax=Parasaccharibacter apium TaxID=1510841 RepID=A0A7U7J169_9PROT|nr:hypothetical protein SACS_1088 [Parasaccharibacter apium]
MALEISGWLTGGRLHVQGKGRSFLDDGTGRMKADVDGGIRIVCDGHS